MKEISIYDFALSGAFGPVKIGMTKDEIVEIIGCPDSDNDFKTGSSGLLYGWYEFFYWTDNKKLFAIQNDHLDSDTTDNFNYSNGLFRFDPWIFTRQIRLQDLCDILVTDKIQFEIKSFNDREIIELQTGFIFDFDNEIWSESDNDWIKIPNYMDSKLIGFRYFKD
jgi:hypothetical protein